MRQSHREWFERDPAYADVPRTIKPVSGSGVALIRSVQPAGFYARPAAAEFSLNLFYQVSGESVADFGGHRLRCKAGPGEIAMMPADAPIAIDNSGAIEACVVLLPKRLVREISQDCGLDGDLITFERLFDPGRDDVVFSLADRLWRETSQSDRLGALFVDEALRLLAIALVRASGEGKPLVPRGGLAGWQLRRAYDAMDAHLADDIGLDALARVAGCSATHFSRAFKQTTGLPPFAWLLNRRIERAKELLADSRMPLAEIALAVGFSAQPQFTTAFKRVTGVTPGAWRRERLT